MRAIDVQPMDGSVQLYPTGTARVDDSSSASNPHDGRLKSVSNGRVQRVKVKEQAVFIISLRESSG